MRTDRFIQGGWTGWVLALVFVLLVSTPHAASATSANDLPEGLSLKEWMSIQSQIRKASYNVEKAGHGEECVYQAANPRQGYKTQFHKNKIQVGPKGKESPEWNFNMRLTGYGYGENIQPVSEPEIVTEGNRVEYRRGNITEWYVNDGNGLEQGFTIQKRAEANADESLKIRMQVESGFMPVLSENRQSVAFKNGLDQTVLKYHKLVVVDAEQKIIPAYMQTGESDLMIIVEEGSAVYPLTVDPVIIYERKVTASYASANDKFGDTVSISGDRVVVGAYGEDHGSELSSGSAYVFEQNTGGMQSYGLRKRLVASDGETSNHFGSSVFIYGDTVVIGASGDDDGGEKSGSAYVFDLMDETHCVGDTCTENKKTRGFRCHGRGLLRSFSCRKQRLSGSCRDFKRR